MSNSAELNNKFSIGNIITFSNAKPDYPPFVRLKSEKGEATISLYGGHLLSYIPLNSTEVIWVSESAIYQTGKAIRGGIPVCWPWFGKNPDDKNLPQHGFARTSIWKISETGIDTEKYPFVVLSLFSATGFENIWPYKFQLDLKVVLKEYLEVSIITYNLDEKPFEITNALHTYLYLSHVENCVIEGLESVEYLDSLENNKLKYEKSSIKIEMEIDRDYQNTQSPCLIKDSEFNRIIKVSKENSNTTVVWNPWQDTGGRMVDFQENGWNNMVCIEAANTNTDKREIPPGQKHILKTRIEVLEFDN